MTRFAPVALCLALLSGCGGGGDKTVAEVGGQKVTQPQLDALVQHFRRQAQLEGRDFPQKGTSDFVLLRNQLLGLLVYRTELQQAASRLGVTVSDADGDTYARDSAEAELLKEGIAAKITRGVRGKTLAERSARRNAVLATFLARLQRQTNVRYEPGFAPGS